MIIYRPPNIPLINVALNYSIGALNFSLQDSGKKTLASVKAKIRIDQAGNYEAEDSKKLSGNDGIPNPLDLTRDDAGNLCPVEYLPDMELEVGNKVPLEVVCGSGAVQKGFSLFGSACVFAYARLENQRFSVESVDSQGDLTFANIQLP